MKIVMHVLSDGRYFAFPYCLSPCIFINYIIISSVGWEER